jgi:uncharacterized protein (DUF488 family)
VAPGDGRAGDGTVESGRAAGDEIPRDGPAPDGAPDSEADGGDPVEMLTVGHGTLAAATFAELLRSANVEVLVDVRSFPGSRRNPQFGREEMARWVPDAGVRYRWERRLGGRRRTRPDSPHVALRNEAFRGYADHMASDDFDAGLDDVLAEAARARVVVMCSESLWWRCHRRLISDAAVLLRQVEVRHLMHGGALRPHVVTGGARRDGDRVVYDVGGDTPLPL